jgi:hypothetical protein
MVNRSAPPMRGWGYTQHTYRQINCELAWPGRFLFGCLLSPRQFFFCFWFDSSTWKWMLKAPWRLFVHYARSRARVTTSSSCYVLTCGEGGDIFIWSVFFYQCWTRGQFILSVRLLVVFVWQVRDGLCLFGSQCLFDHWGIPGISWRGSPIHGRIGRLLVHRRIHFQVIKWKVANYFGFNFFWHSTIIAMSFPLHKFDMSVRSNIVGCSFWQSYYIYTLLILITTNFDSFWLALPSGKRLDCICLLILI